MMVLFLIMCLCLMMLIFYILYTFCMRCFSHAHKKAIFLICATIISLLMILRFSFHFYQITNTFLFDGILYLCTYFFLGVIFLFITSLIERLYIHFHKRFAYKTSFIIALILAIITGSYGIYQGKTISIKEYIQMIPALQKDVDFLAVSDLHISTSVKQPELKALFDIAKEKHVDAILIGGDLFDESTRVQDMEALYQLVKTYQIPIYYIEGNHEQLSSKKAFFLNQMKESGVILLQDLSVVFDQQLIITGRNDKKVGRKPLSQIIPQTTLPVLLMDHRPLTDEEHLVDIQFSGHTHNGQIFPNNPFTSIAFPHIYGRYSSPYPMIVSSGYGTWGFPMRIGSQSEVVLLHLKTQK